MVYGIVLPTLDVIIYDCKATCNWDAFCLHAYPLSGLAN